ncbi:MAG: phosphate ABC transporter permease PstA [Trueperaceae bacterium]
MSSRTITSSVTQPREKSLLQGDEKTQLQRRQHVGRFFQYLTFTPVILALLLIATILVVIFIDTWTWQVVESNGSGQTFARSSANTWDGVVRLELAARGETQEDIDAVLNDPEETRKFTARNRVELVYVPRSLNEAVDGQTGWRWVVTNNRDKVQENISWLEGRRHLPELVENLEDGQLVFLNPWLDFSFFARNNSSNFWLAGLVTAILGSLWVIGLVLLISVPIGVGAAIYLEEYARKGWFAELLEVNLRNLAGVPSIVYGILGLYIFVRLMGIGPVVLAASLTLSLLILPVVVIASREAIRAVPDSLRQASYGLGATRWQTVSRVILPNAVTGIVTGVILAVARALGETAPLLVVGGAGFITTLPTNPFSSYAVMPTQIYSWFFAPEQEFDHAAASGIIALLIVLSIIYALAFFIRRRFERKW